MMVSPLDRAAYITEFEVFDRALESKRGVQISFETPQQAKSFRARMNRARQLDRDLNRKVHADDQGHPLYGQSEYAIFVLRVVHDPALDRWLCKVERAVVTDLVIEEIPGDDDIDIDDVIEEEENEGAD